MSFFKSIEKSKSEQKRLKYLLFSQKFSSLNPDSNIAHTVAIANFHIAQNDALHQKRQSLRDLRDFQASGRLIDMVINNQP